MKIMKTQNASDVTLALEGRLDSTTAPELETELKAFLDDASEIVFDMEKLDYISSAGLRVLLSAQKVMVKKGGMKVIHANEKSSKSPASRISWTSNKRTDRKQLWVMGEAA